MGRICLFINTFYDVYSNANANIVEANDTLLMNYINGSITVELQ